MSASSPSVSSTPQRSATARRRASASSTPSRSIVATEARSTRRIGDPPVEVGRERWVLSLDEVEDELTVSLRAGETRVYDPERLPTRREQGFCNLADDARVDGAVADDALGDLGSPRLELRLHEHERLPPGRGQRERGRQRELDRDERYVARDELRCERQLGEGSRVDALEDRDAPV